AGFASLVRRLRAHEPETAIPLFDRSTESARAGADIVGADTRFVLVEGNYLLLDEPPWSELAGLFDFTIFLDVPRPELEQRLRARWREHGLPDDVTSERLTSNDLPNADRVARRRRQPDLLV